MTINILIISVYTITLTMGVPANILAFYTFCRKVRRNPTAIDVLLLSLTISDLIFLTLLPLKIKEALDQMTWTMPPFLCPITSFLFYTTIYNSTLLLTAVSLERYLGVAFPIMYSRCRRPRYAVIASVLSWVVCSLNLVFVYIVPNRDAFVRNNGSDLTTPQCYMNFSVQELEILMRVRLELFFVLFCVPFFVSCFCYVNFIRILSRLPHISRRRRLRAIGLAVGTLLVFAVSFGPYNFSHVVGFVRKEDECWRQVALLASTFNSCLDPIIFYMTSSDVRSILRGVLRNITAKLHLLRCGGGEGGGGALLQ
ncbi:free fatty acid receptor 2-like [Gadus morhua]|uniref:free fatty acid receptor 2-like n=1 Tax=Gadus morhua TaxID=8049 RepID=UPI0011B6C981|nr:free fatty acid receptor 2-like [Gadus morhua]